MKPEIELALKHWNEINRNGKRWARLEMIRHSDYLTTIRLYEGIIMSDGRKEVCIGVRHYIMRNNEPTYLYSAMV